MWDTKSDAPTHGISENRNSPLHLTDQKLDGTNYFMWKKNVSVQRNSMRSVLDNVNIFDDYKGISTLENQGPMGILAT